MYFEYNLPSRAPTYLDPSLARPFEVVMARISERMNRLEEALNITLADTTMSPAQFAATAKKIWDASPERFDQMSSGEIAMAARLLFDGQPVRERIEFPNATTIVDASFITTKEWEMVRHLGLGGSDSAVAKGISPYTTPRMLYHSKRGTPLAMPDTSAKPQFDRGHILEPKVIGAFCKITGAKLITENRMFLSKTHPHCLADVDGIVEMADGRLYVFEAKSTVDGNKAPWIGGRVPAHYVPQCQHYLAVLDDPRILGTYIGCLFVRDYTSADIYVGSAYDEGDLAVQLIERDEDAEQAVLDNSEWFVSTYLDAEVEPPMDVTHPAHTENGGQSSTPADFVLARRLNGPANKALPAMEFRGQKYADLANEYLKLNDEKSELEAKKKDIDTKLNAIKAPFIEALGTTTTGTVKIDANTSIEVSYTPQARTNVDRTKLKTFFPEAYAECVTEVPEGTRVFKMKKKGGK